MLIPLDIEENMQPAEEPISSSPAAQSFREFNAYSRIALPMLVEANLQAIVNAEVIPTEDRLKVLVVDIIRRCQSTVAQNFEQLKKPISEPQGPDLLSASAGTPDGPGNGGTVGLARWQGIQLLQELLCIVRNLHFLIRFRVLT